MYQNCIYFSINLILLSILHYNVHVFCVKTCLIYFCFHCPHILQCMTNDDASHTFSDFICLFVCLFSFFVCWFVCFRLFFFLGGGVYKCVKCVNMHCIHLEMHTGKPPKKFYYVNVTVLSGRERRCGRKREKKKS